jgi:hypothetical protein
MRRTIMTFATIVSLALSLTGLALAGQVGTAAAATARPAAAAATTYDITSQYPSGIPTFPWSLLGHGAGNLVSVSEVDSTAFEITGRTGKWLELEDAGSGDCLDIVGSVSAGFHVNEENCNGRSAELWWLPSGIGTTQIQNQYGTKLLNHDACLWNAEADTPSAADVTVVKCVASQPEPQIWIF